MRILRASVLLVLIPFTITFGQEREDLSRVHSEGFYINLGAARGPYFSDFFNYLNDYYQARFQNTTESFDRFDKGFDFGLGYIVWFVWVGVVFLRTRT